MFTVVNHPSLSINVVGNDPNNGWYQFTQTSTQMRPAKRRRSPRKHGTPHKSGPAISANECCSTPTTTAPVDLDPAAGIYEHDDLSDSGDGPDIVQGSTEEPEEGTAGPIELGQPGDYPMDRGVDSHIELASNPKLQVPGQ